MDKESLKKLEEKKYPKEYRLRNYAFSIKHCPGYDGYIPENLTHEVCGWCGSIKYYH
jgi:hypothetical protein